MKEEKLVRRLKILRDEIDRLNNCVENAQYCEEETYGQFSDKYEHTLCCARKLFEKAKRIYPNNPFVRKLITDDFEERVSLPLPSYDFYG